MLKRYYKALVTQATAGDQDSAVELLREFSKTGTAAPREAIVYLAECLARWGQKDFAPNTSPRAFNIARTGRPKDPAILQRHLRALRAYFLMRGRGKGHDEAIARAAPIVPLSESMLRKLVEADDDERDTEREAALFMMKSHAVSRRCRKAAGLPLLEDFAPPRSKRQPHVN